MMNMSFRSTRPTEPKWPLSTWRSSASDVAAPAVLQELVVVDGAVVVDHVGGFAVFADHNVRRIAEQLAVETVERDLRAADDGVRRVVVLGAQRFLQVDRVHARVPAACGQYEGIVGKRLLRETQQ
jgi:hypothetical protein